MEISMGPKEKEFFCMKEKYILTQSTWFLVANYVPLSEIFSKKILKFIWKILPPNSHFGTLDSRWLASSVICTYVYMLIFTVVQYAHIWSPQKSKQPRDWGSVANYGMTQTSPIHTYLTKAIWEINKILSKPKVWVKIRPKNKQNIYL